MMKPLRPTIRACVSGRACGAAKVRDIAFVVFLAALLTLGLKRPFIFTLAYAYVDIVSPQRLSYSCSTISLSVVVRPRAGAWFFVDDSAILPYTAATDAACWLCG